MKNWTTICLAVFAVTMLENSGRAEKIVGRGSDSTISLVKALADQFQKKSGITVELQGGGSSKGTAGALAGEVDFAFMSRGPKEAETQAGLRALAYAIDGVAIIVNPGNDLNNISIEQLQAIFSGNQGNWPNGQPIMAINRPSTSGTREVFQNKVLGKSQKFGEKVEVKEANEGLSLVQKSSTAVAYASVGSAKSEAGIKVLTVNKVAPSTKTLLDGTYPITRTLHFAVKGVPSENVKRFVNFALSEEGQSIISSSGYVPDSKN